MPLIQDIIDKVKGFFKAQGKPKRKVKKKNVLSKKKVAVKKKKVANTRVKNPAKPSRVTRKKKTVESKKGKKKKAVKKKVQVKSPVVKRKKASVKATAKPKKTPKSKTIPKKVSVQRQAKSKSSAIDINSPLIGEVTHYFSKIKVIVVKVTKTSIKVGDQINIKGKATDNIQPVLSLQIESVDVKSAKKGQLVGLKVKKPAKVGDKVYKLS